MILKGQGELFKRDKKNPTPTFENLLCQNY